MCLTSAFPREKGCGRTGLDVPLPCALDDGGADYDSSPCLPTKYYDEDPALSTDLGGPENDVKT